MYKQVKKGGSTSDGLFTEIQLAEWLNISRTSLAKAIQELLKEGLLVCMP
ncbi:GntR family transcriptional regulator [Peribacillus simplex]|nr:GntR family transcriptional regulator [Peribacillus simplex]